MITTREKLYALKNWIEQVQPIDCDAGQVYSLVGNYERYGELTPRQQEALDHIIKENQVVIESYLN